MHATFRVADERAFQMNTKRNCAVFVCAIASDGLAKMA
jgi:hypothetical protein